MELQLIISVIVILIAFVFWYQAKVFISSHVDEYNKFIHFIDFKHLKDLKAHDEPHISDRAHIHHMNVKIAVLMITAAVLVLIMRSVN